MARASRWLGCLVEGAAELGRRAMKDASVAERTGAGSFHSSPACCRADAGQPATTATNHPAEPLRWQVDETYVKAVGRWLYVYRAIGQFGQVIDVFVSARRDAKAARRFFERAIGVTKVT